METENDPRSPGRTTTGKRNKDKGSYPSWFWGKQESPSRSSEKISRIRHSIGRPRGAAKLTGRGKGKPPQWTVLRAGYLELLLIKYDTIC